MPFTTALVFLTAFCMFVIYYTLYKHNRLFGNIAFFGISIAILATASIFITRMAGMVLTLGTLINMFYDLITTQ